MPLHFPSGVWEQQWRPAAGVDDMERAGVQDIQAVHQAERVDRINKSHGGEAVHSHSSLLGTHSAQDAHLLLLDISAAPGSGRAWVADRNG